MAQILLTMTAVGTSEWETCSRCSRRFERGEKMNAVEFESGEPWGLYCDRCICEWGEASRYYDLPGFQRFNILVPRTVPVEAVVRMLIALVAYVQGTKSVDQQMKKYRVIAEAAIKPQYLEDKESVKGGLNDQLRGTKSQTGGS